MSRSPRRPGTRRTPRADLRSIWRHAIDAVDPERLVRRLLSVSGDGIVLDIGRKKVELRRDRLWVAGAGKASVAMARAIATLMPEVEGVVIAPRPSQSVAARRRSSGTGRIRVLRGEHPVPSRGSFAATRALVEALGRQADDVTVLLLLSGGASALLAMPAPGVSNADKARLNRLMLRAGMPVAEMNAVRKHVSAVKGGGLLRLAAPRAVITLALSDVPGDALATIGSGPTVADPRPRRQARAALLRRVARADIPAAVLRRLDRGPETVKPGDPLLAHARAAIVGSNRTALDAAARRARALGYAVRRRRILLEGAARREGERIATALRAPVRRPTVFLAGGETVVDATGASGRGGRSQELALAVAPALSGRGWTLLAAGTDGIDGPTPAAGAIVDGRTLARSGASAVERALARHDSHGYFARHGGLFVTGPTGTNVMDVVIAIHPGPTGGSPPWEPHGTSSRGGFGR